MLISAILSNKGGQIISVTGDTIILDVTKVLRQHRIGAVLVKEPDGAIDGVLSERDIIRGLATDGPAILERPAKTLMTREIITCRPSDEVSAALAIMTKNRVRHLPVMDSGTLVGMISIGDLVNARIQESLMEAESLREYIATG
ncbi:MAG: CBS domain-containing protein [Alphaproteobacteria bacterium]|nr:MAG: CBS domain-containing protein [Alphaproteobacteria bacterium]